MHKISETKRKHTITFGANELPMIDVIDKDTGENVRITASYNYKREEFPVTTTIVNGKESKIVYETKYENVCLSSLAECDIEGDERKVSLSTVLKSGRKIEVEQFDLLDDESSPSIQKELNHAVSIDEERRKEITEVVVDRYKGEGNSGQIISSF